MISFKDNDGVWDFSTIVEGDECDKQTIREELMTWKGENFANIDKGVNWHRYINVATWDNEIEDELKSEISKVILDTNLVQEIISIEVKKERNTLTIEYIAVLLNNNEVKDSISQYDNK